MDRGKEWRREICRVGGEKRIRSVVVDQGRLEINKHILEGGIMKE
jgi:hypothetical protein